MADAASIATQARGMAATGRVDQARALLARALAKQGGNAELNLAMSAVCLAAGQRDQAAFYSDRAAKARPDNAPTLLEHAGVLIAASRLADAEAAYARAVALAPRHPQALANYAACLVLREKYATAMAQCRAAARAGLEHPNLTATHASALRCMGLVEEAVGVIRDGARRWPDDLTLAEAHATVLNYVPDAELPELLAAHKRWAMMVERAALAQGGRLPEVVLSAADAGRGLRVGAMSPDFREHAVVSFCEAVLTHLPRDRFEVTAYFTTNTHDHESDRLARLVDRWRECGSLDNRALAKQIRADGIDILIELSGLTRGQRLGAVALRPAPVQVTYIGYPNTTGLAAIDWRLIDAHTDPPGAERWCVERLARLDPCFLCYTAPQSTPAEFSRIDDGDDTIVFGSFNNLQKITSRVMAVWASLLKEVPRSRLMLKSPGLREEEVRSEVLARFEHLGVDRSRIETMPPTDRIADHLQQYRRMDIALDTFPYNGTTTTGEALYMSVPVVTLEGVGHPARVGESMLRAAGLPELVAADEAGYVRVAAALAADRPRLADLRANLRDRVRRSPLCDGPRYGAQLGAALEKMWAQRCETPPPPPHGDIA
ncbi:MAG: hypothetical protein KF745_08955 [Phycisphaeraceae bacterium]|nr:hypothetical protein [Phycisphaeraceae bacterium]